MALCIWPRVAKNAWIYNLGSFHLGMKHLSASKRDLGSKCSILFDSMGGETYNMPRVLVPACSLLINRVHCQV